MFIHDMTEAECRHELKQANVGRIACARDNQPYIVPIYFASDDDHLDWMSLVVFGRYEELPDLPEYKPVREHALGLLQKRSSWWWEPAWVCGDHMEANHLRESPVKDNWFASLFGGWRSQNKGKDLR